MTINRKAKNTRKSQEKKSTTKENGKKTNDRTFFHLLFPFHSLSLTPPSTHLSFLISPIVKKPQRNEIIDHQLDYGDDIEPAIMATIYDKRDLFRPFAGLPILHFFFFQGLYLTVVTYMYFRGLYICNFSIYEIFSNPLSTYSHFQKPKVYTFFS